MTASARLAAGKRGLILGVANDRSIAWGIAKMLSDHGAELAFTYQDETFLKRVGPLAASVGSDIVLHCDVSDQKSLGLVFSELKEKWGSLDFVVHAIAYSDKQELKGKYLDTSFDNFNRTMCISCFSFTAVARHAAPMMNGGGSLLTLTYAGSQRVIPQYNVMGVAKAALEASVRYLAADLGGQGIRVNAISAGPMRTLAGSGISTARYIYKWSQDNAPLRRSLELEEIGGAALYLLSDLSSAVTGEVHHVDCGYHIVGMKAVDGRPVGMGAAGSDEPREGIAQGAAIAADATADSRGAVIAQGEDVDQARTVYDETTQHARKAYEEAIQQSRNRYDELARHARNAYEEAIQQARDAGEAVIDGIRTLVGEPEVDHRFDVADRKHAYSYEDLLRCAHGELFGPGNARLPLPPLLMFDRILEISETGGKYGKGQIVAVLDVTPELWFFDSHFESDPVMPGCLGLDAMWQLVGFYLGWLGAPGRGRALGVGEVKFTGQVLPTAGMVRYRLSIKRVILRRLVLGIADAVMEVDGREIYEAKDIRVGLFASTEDF